MEEARDTPSHKETKSVQNKNAFFSRLRTKLLLLALAPTIPALLMALQSNLRQREAHRQQVSNELRFIGNLIAAHEEGYVKNARQILATLSSLDFLVRTTNENFCRQNLDNLQKLLPDYFNFGLIESNGTLFAAGTMQAGEQVLLGDRSYFRRAVDSRKFSIGDFQISRLTGRPGLNFAFPVTNQNGGVARVLFASLDLERVTQTARAIPLPPQAIVTILDGNGTIVARLPQPGPWLGKSVPDSSLVRQVLAVQNGVFESVGLDGTQRLYTVAAIRDDSAPRLYVSVGIPTEILYSAPDRILRSNLLVLALTVIAAGLLAFIFGQRVLIRPIAALSAAADRIADGSLDTRARVIGNTSELRNLTLAFNEMAARLQRRDSELTLANEQIKAMNSSLEATIEQRTAQLTAANAELEAFSYSVSHDLRAPLRHLDGFAELLRKNQESRLDDKGRRHLEIIRQSARKMGKLIDDLLVFSRMARQEVLKSQVDVASMVRDTIRQMEPDYANRKIEWHIEELSPVNADPAMLKQVWANLIANAVKYTGPRDVARIQIGCSGATGEKVFFVKDNGVGFDMKYADKLFGVFQRLHRDEEFEGTGIGLANVRRIVARHGGRTWAESTLGEGSTFYFSLPA